MLINGRHAEEVRVAIIDESKKLLGYRVAVAESHVQRGNIYRGVVANIEPSLDAAFVEFGVGRHGFLTRHDVVEQAYHHTDRGKNIDQVLQKGMPILVQVTRDAVDNKGATLTSNISLAGRYLVLMPFEDSRGVSRKVEDEDLRRKLREKVKNLVAGDFGFIVRTNAADQTKTDLKADLEQLKRLWKQVLEDNTDGKGPRLLYDDQDLVIQVMRDHLDSDIEEVVVDDEELLARTERYVSAVMPRTHLTLTPYRDRLPLFSRHNLEPQIAAIYRRSPSLPGGGSIVIDHTEALTAIDVNSGKSKGGDRQRDTALSTNLEAAAEVALQLRLRDIGGLVVVDFIDMRSRKHQQAVEKALKDAMKPDRARSHVGRISANGLLELNRQRVGQALSLRTHVPCPTCNGLGRLVNPELMALGLLRRIEARAATGRLERAQIALHPQIAAVVQNRRRSQLAALEREFGITIEITGRADLELSAERIEWQTRDNPIDPPQPQRQEPRRSRPQHDRAETPRAPEGEAKRTRQDRAPRDDAETERDGDASPEARSKRRRRRRPKRKSSGGSNGASTEAASTEGGATEGAPAGPTEPGSTAAGPARPTEAGPTEAGPSELEPTESGAAAPTEGASTGRRRGWRGRRKPNGTSAEAGSAPAAKPAEPSTAGDGNEAQKRRSRRRRRRKPAADGAE